MKCFLILGLLLTLGCSKKDLNRDLIEKEININIQSEVNSRKKDCASQVFEKANMMADSIILTMIQSNTDINDHKPLKPSKPTLKANLDTFDVVPIVPKR